MKYSINRENNRTKGEKSYIIFGAGGGGRKVYDFINKFFYIQIDCFLDNYPKTEEFCGLPVFKATDFLEKEDFQNRIYIIASSYREEIMKQLLDRGVPIKHIWSRIDIVCNNWDVYEDKIEIRKDIVFNNAETIVFDLGNGFVLGGVERWSYNLSRGLLKLKKKVLLLSNNLADEPPQDLSEFAKKTNITNFVDFDVSSIQELVDVLSQYLPLTIFVAHVDDLLLASYFLKQRYPNMIKIISVIHEGLQKILYDNVIVDEMTDYIFCVSNDIQRGLIKDYDMSLDKILFKETPVDVPNIKQRQYNLFKDKPINVGYAARLEKIQKHSELLIPLIEELEYRKVNYVLEIAGAGILFDDIQKFVLQHNLEDHVHLLGKIDYEDMLQFWMHQDLAINLSDFEGCALTMLESMAAGTVPIFTDVSGTRHFIHDFDNGFVVQYGDISQMADRIEYMAENRDLIEKMGRKAYNEIYEKCQMRDYIDYIRKELLER